MNGRINETKTAVHDQREGKQAICDHVFQASDWSLLKDQGEGRGFKSRASFKN